MTGRYVRALRKTLALTPAEMADLLAVTHQTIYKWEGCPGTLPPMGLAQRQLLVLIGSPSTVDARRIRSALRAGGRLAAWAYLTRESSLGAERLDRRTA